MVVPKASKRLSDADSTLSDPVEPGGRDVSRRGAALLAWAHLGRQGVESGPWAFNMSIYYDRPATTSGAAAEAHGKVADGPREVRASASAFFGRNVSPVRHGK